MAEPRAATDDTPTVTITLTGGKTPRVWRFRKSWFFGTMYGVVVTNLWLLAAIVHLANASSDLERQVAGMKALVAGAAQATAGVTPVPQETPTSAVPADPSAAEDSDTPSLVAEEGPVTLPAAVPETPAAPPVDTLEAPPAPAFVAVEDAPKTTEAAAILPDAPNATAAAAMPADASQPPADPAPAPTATSGEPKKELLALESPQLSAAGEDALVTVTVSNNGVNPKISGRIAAIVTFEDSRTGSRRRVTSLPEGYPTPDKEVVLSRGVWFQAAYKVKKELRVRAPTDMVFDRVSAEVVAVTYDGTETRRTVAGY